MCLILVLFFPTKVNTRTDCNTEGRKPEKVVGQAQNYSFIHIEKYVMLPLLGMLLCLPWYSLFGCCMAYVIDNRGRGSPNRHFRIPTNDFLNVHLISFCTSLLYSNTLSHEHMARTNLSLGYFAKATSLHPK